MTPAQNPDAGLPTADDVRGIIPRSTPAQDAAKGCDWPDKLFGFLDEPGEHDPCYVVMPDGAMLSLNHHAGEGVDIARAKFIVSACNAALRATSQTPDAVRETRMLDTLIARADFARKTLEGLQFAGPRFTCVECKGPPENEPAEIQNAWREYCREIAQQISPVYR